MWFALGAICVCLAVLGTYFYAKHRMQNPLKQVPGKINLQVQQSAQGFTISKSDQGRTLFKLQAGKAVQFKEGGRAELHDVTITLYGRDSSRFDQVYGKTFEYDAQTGDVTSKDEVTIDLESNPSGILNPDQSAPKELKNPIHLKTNNLVFNKNTGDIWSAGEIDFRVPQAAGSAVGARYSEKDGTLTLQSQVKIVSSGRSPMTIEAGRAVVGKASREVALSSVHASSATRTAQADQVTFFLKADNTLDRLSATGNVRIASTGSSKPEITSQNLAVQMEPGQVVKTATLSGNVHLLTEGPQSMEADAGRAELAFSGRNTLTRVHAEQQVTLLQKRKPAENAGQDVRVSAPAMDFIIAEGKRLRQAETAGTPQILLSGNQKQGETRVTAQKFVAKFDSQGQLAQLHGAPDARVVSSPPKQENAPQPDRVTTSDTLDAQFRSGGGVETLVQAGHFTYAAGPQRAFADKGIYRVADQTFDLSGSPRVLDSGMETSANSVRLSRATGAALAMGDVKTTYSDLKPQPGGALLASSDPIHVTAQQMTGHNSPASATYTGNARLWQNANVIEAPTIAFQKDQRIAQADSSDSQKVSTVLIATDKSGRPTPVTVTSDHLVYRDAERKAHYSGGVTVKGSDLTITSNQMDVFLAQAGAAGTKSTGETPGPPQISKLDKIIASVSVVITEPNRRATGDKLTYTAGDDKFVLTGGPPSIFDAEHGKITGVSLTLFRRDGSVEVEGDNGSPAVTRTRVVR